LRSRSPLPLGADDCALTTFPPALSEDALFLLRFSTMGFLVFSCCGFFFFPTWVFPQVFQVRSQVFIDFPRDSFPIAVLAPSRGVDLSLSTQFFFSFPFCKFVFFCMPSQGVAHALRRGFRHS
jgi:hypothetical protein